MEARLKGIFANLEGLGEYNWAETVYEFLVASLNEAIGNVSSRQSGHHNTLGFLSVASVVLQVFHKPKQRHSSMVICKLCSNGVRVGLMSYSLMCLCKCDYLNTLIYGRS